jgi:hypothetical protein
MVDKLHTLHLGPAQSWVCSALWQLILADAWETGATGDALHMLSVQRIKSELWSWYKDVRRERPDCDVTQVQDFTLNMLGGKPSTQGLHTKGAETKGLVPFVVMLVDRFKGRLGVIEGDALHGAGVALQAYFDLLESSPRNVPPHNLQRMFDMVKRHIVLSLRAGIPMKPKHHLLLHLVERTAVHGNPGFYSTFADEGINRVLKRIGEGAHRSVWEARVFAHFGKLESRMLSRKRPAPSE